MSEASDDAQPPAQGRWRLRSRRATRPSDADDVEVWPKRPSLRRRQCRVTIRCHPRRASWRRRRSRSVTRASPARCPPPAASDVASIGSLKAPSAPPSRFTTPRRRRATPSPLRSTGSESLRAIGEALAKDAGAFSTTESADRCRRPCRGRARSRPSRQSPTRRVERRARDPTIAGAAAGALTERAAAPRDKVPTVPDEPAASARTARPSRLDFRAAHHRGRHPFGAPARRCVESAPPPARVSSPPPPRRPSAPPPPAVQFVPPPPPAALRRRAAAGRWPRRRSCAAPPVVAAPRRRAR